MMDALMLRRLIYCCVLSLVSVIVAPLAWAQGTGVSGVYVERPLVLPEHNLRIDAGHRFPRYDAQFKHVLVRDGDDSQYINPGVSYGVGSDIEVGLVLPFQISPDASPRNPRAHIQFRFLQGEAEVGALGVLSVGPWGGANAIIGVPVLWHFTPGARLDTGGFLTLSFADSRHVGLVLPAQLPFQLMPELYAGPEVIVTVGDLFHAAGFGLDLGAFLGYNLDASEGSVIDVYTRFRALNVTHGMSAFELMLGLEWYFSL
jgi:hypothetical protein